MTQTPATPHLLLILDGWGHREATEDNAIAQANTPTWDKLWKTHPHGLIDASGLAVGLPDEQIGNSEVGHMNLGTGRVVYQTLTRINQAIEQGTWHQNSAILAAIQAVKNTKQQLHIMGLISPGGVHSHQDHLLALLECAREHGLHQQVQVHAFLDGRDTPPKSAEPSLQLIADYLEEHQLGDIASLCGRFYAMDRDERWDRIAVAYHLLVAGISDFTAPDWQSGLTQAYQRNESDEFVQPTRIGPAENYKGIQDNDAMIFFNFRSDRARQLARAFLQSDFSGFTRTHHPQLKQFVSMAQYADDLPSPVAFPPEQFENTLGRYLSDLQKTQLRIAETEKYAHVTFFFNGGVEAPYPGETRILIDSPKDVATYDLKPEMSAFEVTEQLVDAIESGQYDLLVCNLANGDMVGHTGNFAAALQAAEVIDQCLAKITSAIQSQQGHCLITADHGNLEMMRDAEHDQAHTAHTSLPVPIIYVGSGAFQFRQGKTQATPAEVQGSLSDISPTILQLMGLNQPTQMTGQPLLETTEHA